MFDKKHRVREQIIQTGDEVLIKQQKTTHDSQEGGHGNGKGQEQGEGQADEEEARNPDARTVKR